MSKKKSPGTDIGYRAYFAAFAVMIIIVIAAICILSGCLDEIIFRAEPISIADSDNSDTEGESGDTDKSVDPSVDTEEKSPESDKTSADTKDEVSSEDPDSSEETKDTEKDTEPKDTEDTKKPEDTTETTAPVTSDDTTAPITTEKTDPEPEPPKDDILSEEIIKEVDGNLDYKYDSASDTIAIRGYIGSSKKISVARELDATPVVSIGSSAFADMTSLEEIKLSAGIQKIESKAMANCPELKYVYIPTTVKSISSDAFEGSYGVVIHGKAGSYAQKYASDNGLEFVAE